MNVELRQLRYLVAVADEGNFTRAADKVFVSQSALSQQIQVLEQEVGATLLDRSRRGVRLTAAGEILYQHAKRMFHELTQANTAIQELAGLQRGELRVGVVQTVNDYLMPTLAARFAEAYPGVKLWIEELATDDIETQLEQGELQVGLSFLPAAAATIETAPLYEEQLVLIVGQQHRLAGQSRVAVAKLDDMPLVMLSRTFCTRRLWEDSARLGGIDSQVVMEMNTVSSILAVVERTDLATVLPRLTLLRKPNASLVSIKLYDPTPSRQVGLLWHRNSYQCSATRAFMDLAHEVCETVAASHPA